MGVPYNTNLPPDLKALKNEIEGYAREYGLDFFETIFEVLDAEDLNEVAAYGGFPTRYPHWSFGMSYEELHKGYDYGLSKIYEMVINNDPCYAYLMRCNHMVDQKLVMAHVYGHCDFFKNNAYFAHTSRKMMDEMANHGVRIRHYVEKHGEDEVEAFVDRCMSIDDLIDVHSTAIRRREEVSRYDFKEEAHDEMKLTRFKSKSYMDGYINPPALLKQEEEEKRKLKEEASRRFPERPEKDILLFLIEHAPIKPWQRDVLSIIRDEAYYFAPQGQTKIMNEGWACVVPNSLVFTDIGLVLAGEIVGKRCGLSVSDGETPRRVYDWATFVDREIVTIGTRRGLKLAGSATHRVMLPQGDWRRLDELHIGDRVVVSGGHGLWANEYVQLDWKPEFRITLDQVAEMAGVSSYTVYRHRAGKRVRERERLAALLTEYDRELVSKSFMQNTQRVNRIPALVDEDLGSFLGYLTGDGNISTIKRVIGLTTGDEEQVTSYAKLVTKLFGIAPRVKWDEGRWRVLFSSRTVEAFLLHLGMKAGFSARKKVVPDVILRSPRPVVAAFLRSLYDCDGYAGKQGVILSTSSEIMGEMVQLLLMNFGILSSRRPHKDGCWHIHTTGSSVKVFQQEIGFSLARKTAAVEKYLADHQWFKVEEWQDEIVSIEHSRGEVVDFSVEHSHRYAAQGFINHNSYWHSTIMTQRALDPSEVIDFADHHSGTMAMSRGRLNPYKLGIEMFRDIEMRWNTGRFGKEFDECDDLDTKRKWDRKLNLGRQKIFEVRKIHNDITFIDTFLTPEFCVEHKLFSFGYEEQADQYVIDSREFNKIKQRLLFSLTNHGRPWIYVVDGNYRNRGELLLRHEHNGIDLRMDQAADTLANVQFIWSRPVHLQTVVDEQPTMLTYDGTEHSIKTLGEQDDPRRKNS